MKKTIRRLPAELAVTELALASTPLRAAALGDAAAQGNKPLSSMKAFNLQGYYIGALTRPDDDAGRFTRPRGVSTGSGSTAAAFRRVSASAGSCSGGKRRSTSSSSPGFLLPTADRDSPGGGCLQGLTYSSWNDPSPAIDDRHNC
jgi:hypothetical protein